MCQVGSVPIPELNKFLTITQEIAKHPVQMFYLEAYRRTKQHIAHLLRKEVEASQASAFSLYEKAFIRGTLIDQSALHDSLVCLRDGFQEHYGDRFQLGRTTNPS